MNVYKFVKKMLWLRKNPPKELSEKELEIQQHKDREDTIKRISHLKRLIQKEGTGWKEFVKIVEEYIAACYKKKMITQLNKATPHQIEQLRFLDHEIDMLEWVLQCPSEYITKSEEELKEAV